MSIIDKNGNLSQWATEDLRKKANEKFDSIILQTFLRIAHIEKKYAPKHSRYLCAGILTVIYSIWVWIPLKHRFTHWWSVYELQRAIKKYLNFDMSIDNLERYCMKLCHGHYLIVKRGKNSWLYSVRPTKNQDYNLTSDSN